MTHDKALLKNSIKEITSLTDEFTNADIKKMNGIMKVIDNAKTADDIWQARIKRDKLFSTSVKQATDISAPTTRKANTLWKVVRDLMNESLDDVVTKQG